MSETTGKSCINCTYFGIRDDSSNFCMIPGKALSGKACAYYKSTDVAMAEQAERTKLREAVQFIQTYCENNHNCKGCPFDRDERCGLVLEPRLWNTDL